MQNNESLRLALAQINVTVGDLKGNSERILATARHLAPQSPDLIVFPELSLTGYLPEDLLFNREFVDANLEALKVLAKQATDFSALVGYVDVASNGKLLDAAALISEGKILGRFYKRCLPNYGVFDEKRYFTKAAESGVFKVGNTRLGVLICEDLWETAPAADLSSQGAQIIVCLSASPYHQNKWRQRAELFSGRAASNRIVIAYCNLVGGQDELVFDGGSMILSAEGKLLAHAKQLDEDVLVHDVSCKAGQSAVAVSSLFDNCPQIKPAAAKPVLTQQPESPLVQDEEELLRALVLGLRDYVKKNGFKTVVLGLSGGIDSAVTACIAEEALGKEHVVGVVMPSRYSSDATQSDAVRLAEQLGIRHRTFAIQKLFDLYRESLEQIAPGLAAAEDVSNEAIVWQNVQARIRGNLLMGLSNQYGWLVVTTGNKSEMATGYTTLYGDMAGGFAVIKDVPKLWVYRLARFINRRKPVIPEGIIERPPSAELAENQKDEDNLPPYEILDPILAAYVERAAGIKQMLAENVADEPVLRRVVGLVNRAEYKRRQGPIGIKITPLAFGKDRRMPITNAWRD